MSENVTKKLERKLSMLSLNEDEENSFDTVEVGHPFPETVCLVDARTMGKAIYQIRVLSNTSVADIRRTIANAIRMSTEEFEIKCGSKILENDKMEFSQIGYKPTSPFKICIRSEGGH